MKEQSTSKGFAILSAANIITKVLSFLYLPFLLKILNDEGYGCYSAAYQVYVFIYVITNSGIPSAVSKIVSEFTALRNYKDALRSFKIARTVLVIAGLFMSVILLVLARPISSLVHFEKSYMAIIALAPSIFITSVASAYRGYFQGKGNMTPTAVSQIVEQIVNSVFTLVLAAFFVKYGMENACAGGAAATSLAALFSLVVLIVFYIKHSKENIPFGQEIHEYASYSPKRLLLKILNYGIPITAGVALQYTGNIVDLANTKSRLMAAGITDAKATEMFGYLSKYIQLVNVPISIVVALTAVIMPAIAAAVAVNNKQTVKRKFDFAFRLCFLITIPAAVGLAVLSAPIYDLLSFQPGSYLMQYGSIVIVLMAVSLLQTTILQGASRMNTATTNIVLGIIVKIVVNYFLIAIPAINITGALIGSISGYVAAIVLNSIAIRRYLKIKENIYGLVLKPFAASAAMGLVAFLIYRIGFSLGLTKEYMVNAVFTIVNVAVCGLTYLVVLILLKGLTEDDLEILPGSVFKVIPKEKIVKFFR